MNSTLSLANEQAHPPIALSLRGLLDRAVLHSGLALVQWARRSELLRSQQHAHQRERAARHHQLDSLRAELAGERARLDTHLLFRSLQ